MKPFLLALISCGVMLFACRKTPEHNQDSVVSIWDRYTLNFEGPQLSENPETFMNYRLLLHFKHGATGKHYEVPGFYAADGNAAETGAASGKIWKVHFTPDALGEWTYEVSFKQGEGLAVLLDSTSGKSAGFFDGMEGSFSVEEQGKELSRGDFRSKGMLRYVGAHYLQFAGTGQYFIKGGAGSPENFLAYEDFDGTFDNGGTHFPALGTNQLHGYKPHQQDYGTGDPVWRDSLGTEIIGALNYIASKGLNSAYILTMNVKGDGDDVWPWTGPENRKTFDVSKLEQWEIVFDHMDKLGLAKDILLTETENENLFEALDGGDFSDTRKLYYRELIARFGHHLGLSWNLGEEIGHDPDTGEVPYKLPTSNEQRKWFAEYIRTLDPYDHHLVVHNWPGDEEVLFGPLLGNPNFEGISLQEADDYYEEILQWREASARAGRKWVLAVDEPLGWEYGLRPDEEDPEHDIPRKEVLWASLFAGGAGVDWYFGWQNNAPTSDLSNEDWRSRENMWEQTQVALNFFNTYLPFAEMEPVKELSDNKSVLAFAKPGVVYAFYLKEKAEIVVELDSTGNIFNVGWYNPKTGGDLREGTVKTLKANGKATLGTPLDSWDNDWIVLLNLQAER